MIHTGVKGRDDEMRLNKTFFSNLFEDARSLFYKRRMSVAIFVSTINCENKTALFSINFRQRIQQDVDKTIAREWERERERGRGRKKSNSEEEI